MYSQRCIRTLILILTVMTLSTVKASTNFEALARVLPPEVKCPGDYDLAVILDRSQKISEEMFAGYIELIKDLLHLFHIKDGGNRFGLVLYNNNAEVVMNLNENNNIAFIDNYLMTSLPEREGDCDIPKALRETRKRLLTEEAGDRPDVPNVCLLLTTEADGAVRKNKQFRKIKDNGFCNKFVVLRSGDDTDLYKTRAKVCPAKTEEEAKIWTVAFCSLLFSCTSTYYNDLTDTCNANKTACPLPYVDVGGHCYQAVFTKMAFDEHATECTNRNGYLAQVDTQEEISIFTQYLISLMASRDDWAFWIGLRDMTGDNMDWRWINDGSNLTDNSWGNNQPNNNHQQCALAVANPIFGGSVGVWDDFGCTAPNHGGICESDRVTVSEGS